MVVDVRALGPDEWKVYREVRLRGLRTDPRAFGARLDEEEAQPEAFWRERLSDPLARTFVTGDAQGVCTLRLAERMAPRRGLLSVAPAASADAEVLGMWVAPELRGRGAGRALLEAALAEARARGATSVALWVNVEQADAARLYARMGFAPDGAPERGTRDPSRVFQRMTRRL